MRREAGTFACADHAIAVAYLMLAYPIEPKNPTQLICEALRDRFDATYERKELSGLSPHEWHAQAVFTVKVMERTLGKGIGFHILHARCRTGEEGAASARRVSEWLNPQAPADSREQEVTDMLTAHILRGRPRLRDLCDSSILPYSALQRPASAYRVPGGRCATRGSAPLGYPNARGAHRLHRVSARVWIRGWIRQLLDGLTALRASKIRSKLLWKRPLNRKQKRKKASHKAQQPLTCPQT